MSLLCYILLGLNTLICVLSSEMELHGIPNKIRFPAGGSGMGFFLAVAIPLDMPYRSVYMSYNFQAHYALPENTSYFNYPPLIESTQRSTNLQDLRGIGRKLVYELLEMKLERNGDSGRMCLLRAICEAAALTIRQNGLLGDLLHIILTPSSTINDEHFSVEFNEAEEKGMNKDCQDYYKSCSKNTLDLISWVGNIV